jgi:hypothetical protein
MYEYAASMNGIRSAYKVSVSKLGKNGNGMKSLHGILAH